MKRLLSIFFIQLFLLTVYTAGAKEMQQPQVTADTTINEAEEDEAIEDILKREHLRQKKKCNTLARLPSMVLKIYLPSIITIPYCPIHPR